MKRKQYMAGLPLIGHDLGCYLDPKERLQATQEAAYLRGYETAKEEAIKILQRYDSNLQLPLSFFVRHIQELGEEEVKVEGNS